MQEGPPTLPPGCEAVRSDTGLELIEIETGSGVAAADGCAVGIEQRTWLLEGTLIQDTRAIGSPQTFRLGHQEVIPALEEGVVGMKVGGKRRLIVPSDLAYGPTGEGEVPPYATLIIDVELITVS